MSVTDAAADAALTQKTVDALNKPVEVNVDVMPYVLRRISGLALQHKWRLGLSLACTIGSVSFGLVSPQLFGHAINQVQALLTHQGDPKAVQASLWLSAFLVIGVSVVRGGLQLLSGYHSEWVSQRVAFMLRL